MAEKKKSSSKPRTPSTKTIVKKTVKKASKSPGGIIAIAIGAIVLAALVVVYFLVPFSFLDNMTLNEYMNKKEDHTSHHHAEPISFDGTVYEDFQINFLELGNWYTGDSIFIKAGENDILIDAGSRYNSTATIESFIDSHCTDGKLEYVIATHAHEDHIAGFSGGASKDGIFYKYDIGTIIEFAKTDSTSAVYTNYVDARNYAVNKGAKCYTALQAYNDPSLKEITLGNDMKMTTLYQKYYEQKSSTENDYSVCTLFTYKNHNFLFTGDLESGGEKSLVASNTLPKCDLYKAGHHGSKTSSSKDLLKEIEPDVICCCCCCGSNEYTSTNNNQFPTQDFINRVAPYTENIFVTTISTDNKNKTYASMNGTICFSSNGDVYSVVCSNNNTILKDTDWFKANRTWPKTV